jgi:hypothetical protein
MEAAEMKLLKPSGYFTLLSHIRNKEINQVLNVANIIDINK